jgi:hypothetical protein
MTQLNVVMSSLNFYLPAMILFSFKKPNYLISLFSNVSLSSPAGLTITASFLSAWNSTSFTASSSS